MKPLLVSAGVIALAVSAAACDSPDRVAYDAPLQTSDASGSEAPMTVEGQTVSGEAGRQTFATASGEIEASDLIGASVHNAAGEEIATVSDIRLAEAGIEPMIILRDGGVAGVGGDLHTIGFQAANIVPDPDMPGDEPDLIVQFTGETLKTLPKFEQAEADDYSLASELMGTSAEVSFSGEPIRINDLILTNTGEARFAVISTDLISPEQIVVDADAVKVAEGDTASEAAVTVELTEQEFAEAPEYPRE